MKLLLMLFALLSQLCSCSEAEGGNGHITKLDKRKAYSLSSPKKIMKLTMDLDEVSGLTYYKKNQLACINDEEGKVFIYDLRKEKVVEKIRFGKDGDYEGVAYLAPNFYVIKSNGKLNVYNEESGETQKVDLPFGSKNDLEGVCVESETSLLLALKGRAGKNEEEKEYKAIYRFDITTHKVQKAYTIPKKKKLGLSGITLNQSGDKLYLLSHRTKELYELNTSTKEIVEVYDLDRKLFAQPEGICITPQGKLYIANERADRSHATILEF